MDPIDRQAAIDAMTNTLWHYPNECYRNLNEYEFAKGLAELGLKSVPSAQPEVLAHGEGELSAQPDQQWIPCSERLPEEDGDYWVTADPRYVPPRYKSTDIILWSNGKWMMADYFILDGEGRKMPEYNAVEVNIPIIAWMPLPEPYKERREE